MEIDLKKLKEQEVYVKIPKERIAVLIGKKGKDKKDLEALTGAKIEIDSETGDVTIKRNDADAFTFYRLEQVVKAIGRGFSPMHAKLLLDPDYHLEILDLKDYGIRTEKARITKRGRVIGSKGTVRQYLENALDCYIAVQGKTVSIIGKRPELDIAKEAIEMLLTGANIPTMKRMVERRKSSIENWLEEW